MLHAAFRSLPVVRVVHRAGPLPASAGAYAHDTITLGWEERVRGRGRRTSDGGTEFGTALDRGTVLRGGDRLLLETLAIVVTVVERPEAVFVIEPGSPSEWALFAYHIGNCHQPLMLTDEAIVCADLPGMEETLDYHRIPFTRRIQPFTPIADGAAQTHQP
jgi:urease accessory protein UreE